MLLDAVGVERVAVGSRIRSTAVCGDPPPQSAVRHGLRVLVTDDLGVIVLCQCNRWGVATSTVERAEEAYSREHLTEYGFRYVRGDDE